MRVLILGAAGRTGRRTAAELARREEVTDLIVTGLDYEPLHRFASLFGERVRPARVDAEDSDDVRAACSQADVVVNCAGPAYLTETAAVVGAIEAGAAYVSLCDDYAAAGAAIALDERARETGALVIPGCGLAPGLTTMLARLARAELDDVHEIELSLAPSFGDLPTEAHSAHLVHALSSPVPVLSEHEERIADSRGGPHLVYFPEPVGWVETVTCAHAEMHNLRSPDLGALTIRLGLTERAAMDALRALSSSPFSTLRSARRALAVAHALPPRGPQWSAARVDVVGSSDGRTATVSLGVVDHLINLATAPLTLAAVELGSGRVEGSGVKSADQVFDPREFLASLGGRGIGVARLEAAPV
jgi:NAD(P)-dependent dehydrogenase (short-subunit alcohol dehydrogenase family)